MKPGDVFTAWQGKWIRMVLAIYNKYSWIFCKPHCCTAKNSGKKTGVKYVLLFFVWAKETVLLFV